MAVKTHTWISLWFMLITPIIVWDICYCFMRPRSMKGGDLHWMWEPYGSYQELDYLYGLPSFESKNGFTNAQSLLNIIETLMKINYLYLAHIAQWPPATIIGFGTALMTFAKAMLYCTQEYYCGFCNVGHNTASDLFYSWIVPKVVWTVVHLLIACQLGKDLANSVNIATRRTEGIVSDKRN